VSWGYDPPVVVVPLLQPCWNPGSEKKTMHGAFQEGGRAQRHEMGGYTPCYTRRDVPCDAHRPAMWWPISPWHETLGCYC
jgi:hypothetical protein